MRVGRVAQSVQRLDTGWTVRGSNPGWGEIFHTCPDRPWGPPSLLYNGYRLFPGGTERPGRDADPSSPSSAVVMNEQSYTSTPPMGRTACTEHQCLYKGALLVGENEHTPFGLYSGSPGFKSALRPALSTGVYRSFGCFRTVPGQYSNKALTDSLCTCTPCYYYLSN